MRTLSLVMRFGWALVMIYAPVICLTFCQVVDAVHHRPTAAIDWRHEWAIRHLPTKWISSDATVDAQHTPFLEHLRAMMRVFTEVNVYPLMIVCALNLVRRLTPIRPGLPITSSPDVPHPPPRTLVSAAQA